MGYCFVSGGCVGYVVVHFGSVVVIIVVVRVVH